MSQKLERQVLQRTYTYDNGDYLLVLDLGRTGLNCDLGFDRGHLHVTVYHPNRGMIGEFSVPVRKRIKGEPEYKHNNGVITLEAKIDRGSKASNFDSEDIVEDAYPDDGVDKIEGPEPEKEYTESEDSPTQFEEDTDELDEIKEAEPEKVDEYEEVEDEASGDSEEDELDEK